MRSVVNLLIHALFGAVLGTFTAMFFLTLYYGIQYDVPVSNSIRFYQALWGTIFVVASVFIVMYHKSIAAIFVSITPEESDEIE